MRWDLFCRVIDNYGDIGVSWRLACDLAARGETVRLWVDDPSALGWMAPPDAPAVEVVAWGATPPDLPPGDVVIEAFGCDPPARFIEAMHRETPLWINLEYLSAEDFVERSHRLPSPQSSGPGAGLTKWFFYPGFTTRTGGLLREPGLIGSRQAFQREPWMSALGLSPKAGERVVTVFCYEGAPLDRLLKTLAPQPTLVLLAGAAAHRLAEALSPQASASGLRLHAVPLLSQPEFDRLLWSADLNFVRGEDSFVRAQWAKAPFVWQIYPQHDGAHAAKLEAFLDRMAPSATVRQLWHAWNGLGEWPERWPSMARWAEVCERWREHLLEQADLTTQLVKFVREKRLK